METKDIIAGLVANLNKVITIISTVDNTDGTITMEVDCTYWMMQDCKYMIGANVYRVINIANTTVSLKPLVDITPIIVENFVLPPPKYYNGTYKMVKNEINGDYDKSSILPFVWLFEIIEDGFVNDDESMIDRTSDIRIYFTASANYENWLYNDHYDYVIYPMKTMVDAFLDLIRASRFFTDVFDYRTTNLVNLSVQGTQEESIFDLNLTGIELRITSDIRKDLNCNEKCL